MSHENTRDSALVVGDWAAGCWCATHSTQIAVNFRAGHVVITQREFWDCIHWLLSFSRVCADAVGRCWCIVNGGWFPVSVFVHQSVADGMSWVPVSEDQVVLRVYSVDSASLGATGQLDLIQQMHSAFF